MISKLLIHRFMNLRSLLLSTLWIVCAASGAESHLTLPALNGEPHSPLKVSGKSGAVMVFVSPYCPTANSLMPEVAKIAAEFSDKFFFYLIQSDKNLKKEDALQHAEMFQVKMPVLLDSEQKLALRLNAKITPEAVVTDAAGGVIYQGRINDLYLGPTKKQRQATRHDLRDALTAIANGKPVPSPQEPAVGCKIGGLGN